jgi:myosin-3
VFLKYYHVEQLNLLLRELIARVMVMQAYTKGWLGARRYRREKEKRNRGAVVIQSGSHPPGLIWRTILHKRD